MAVVINGNGAVTGLTALPDSAMAEGSVIQVVQTFKNDSFSSTSTSYVDITGFSVTITPTSSTNKILLLSCAGISTTGGSSVIYMNLLRGSTAIAQPSDTAGFASTATIYPELIQSMESWNFTFLDSPATTSATTYKWQAKTNSTELTINDRDFDDMNRSSSMIAMEVSA